MDASVSGNIAILRPIFELSPGMTKLHRIRILAVLVGTILMLAGRPTPAQPAPASRQELGNLILEGIPPRDPELDARLEHYRQSRQATFLDWLPDGGMLVTTRF